MYQVTVKTGAVMSFKSKAEANGVATRFVKQSYGSCYSRREMTINGNDAILFYNLAGRKVAIVEKVVDNAD